MRLTGIPSLSGQSGKLSRELDFVSHHVRTKLDELKRQEVSRLRMLLKAKMDAEQEPSKWGWGRRAHSLPTANYAWTIDQIFLLEGKLCCWLVVFFPFFSSIIIVI